MRKASATGSMFLAVLAAGLMPFVMPAGAPPVLAMDEFRYSEDPLRQPSLMTTAEVAVELARFNNAMSDRAASLPQERTLAAREHAYLLVDSILKIQHAEGRTEFNDFEKLGLATMFDLATRLGVYGAGFAAKEVGGPGVNQVAEPLLPPDPFELRLEFPSFFLSSRLAPWRLQFPYYFMIWEAKRFVAKNGLTTDLVAASTSFAPHEGGDGTSQATLMFMYSPVEDCRPFDQLWLEMLGVDKATKSGEALLPGSATYTTPDRVDHMRKEITLSDRGDGCAAFSLLGRDGPFQANRVSYLDFVKSFSDFSATPHAMQASPEPQCSPGQRRYEGNCVTDPLIRKKVQPEYPRKALKKRAGGKVELEAIIELDGSVTNPVVKNCTQPGVGFEKAAIKAVKQWRYTTVLVNGVPRRSYFTIVVTFEFPDP